MSYSGPSREILQGGTRLLCGLGDRLRLLSKLNICCPIKLLVNFHKSLSEFYLIIFLNKLEIVENTPNNLKNQKNKASMAKAMRSFRDSQVTFWLSGHGLMYRLSPSLIPLVLFLLYQLLI